MASEPRTPHDSLFRALISEPERGARLVRQLLPPDITVLIADAPLERIPETFVDRNLGLRQADALFRAKLEDGRPALLYVLLEHKSDEDPWAPLQMARYIVRIWTWHAGLPEARPGVLPPVVPVLVHHGRRPWKGPLSVLDMIEAPEGIAGLARSLSCVLHDLGSGETERLSEDPGIRSVLAALRHTWDRPVPEDVLQLILSGPPDGTDLEVQLVTYIVRLYDLDRGRLEAALRLARPERWEELMGTVADELVEDGRKTWIAHGRAEGLAEGVARGRAEGVARGRAEGVARGRAEGKAETLLQLSHIKFGGVPDARVREIRAADAATLDRWLEALVSADTLEAVFRSH